MAKVYFKVEGMDKLLKSFKKLENVPQKHVTASVKKSMTPILREVKAAAPSLSGDLRKGIIMVGEKAKAKGKKVYRIVFDRGMNDVFQKPVKEPGKRGSPKPRDIAYYPVSQEYGYFAGEGKYIPGFKFAHKAFNRNTARLAKSIVDIMQKKMEAEIAKEGLK